MTGFMLPTQDQVRESLRRIPTPQLRRAFFEGLKNPLWLEPLAKEGAFQNPPARITTDDGVSSDQYWPEIEYVVQVAAEVPSVAVEIFVGLTESDNVWVRRALFAVGAVIPAQHAARLKPVLKAWVNTGFGWRTDPRDMVKFAVSLLLGGERKTGEWLANVLFRPGIREDSRKPDLVLEGYWYESGLPQVAQALGVRGLPLVLGWLVEYERSTGRDAVSFLSRPSIRDRAEMGHGVEDALVDVLRELAIARISADPNETVSKLLAVDMVIVRRIAMFAATEALLRLGDGSEIEPEIIASASRLLFDPASNDERFRVEFGGLAREVARYSRDALDPLAGFVATGAAIGVEKLRMRLGRDDDEVQSETENHVANFSERWEHLWLASVGADALPVVLKLRLAELDGRRGVIDEPLSYRNQFTSWTGPNSPVSQDEIVAMSSSELVAHLESWHDMGDGWGPEPSHEGQARELMSVLTSNPKAISGVSELASRLRPTYLRAILSAWEAAFKANLELDWVQVLGTINGVMTHDVELDVPREGGDFDDDPDFTWAKQAAIGLLDELVKKYEPVRVPKPYLDEYAGILLDAADDATAWIAYTTENGDNETDSLTLSLNWHWPILTRGLVALVCHGPGTPWSERARIILLRELDREDPRGASRAVIGESLSRLLNSDRTWTEEQIPAWFGTEKNINQNQQIALSTAVSIHYYHPVLYRLLSPSMLSALRLRGQIAEGWKHGNSSPAQRIGEWAVNAVIFDDVNWDDPVLIEFFAAVEPAIRGESLGHIARQFMNATSVDDSIRDRFGLLWESRIVHAASHPVDSAELRNFHWVIKSGRFATDWWLPRLKRILEIDQIVPNESLMIGEEIANAADVDARTALAVTKIIFSGEDPHGMATYDLTRYALPKVIARAIDSGDDQLATEATEFMNEMGEAGNLGLAKQVQEVIDGIITPNDKER